MSKKPAKYEVYGERSRPDSYPTRLYRLRDGYPRVDQLLWGRWLQRDDMRATDIHEQVEKGLLWNMGSALIPWSDTTVDGQPLFLEELHLRVGGSEAQLLHIAENGLAGVGELRLVSLSKFTQSGSWWVLDHGRVTPGIDGPGSLAVHESTSQFFGLPAAAEKAWRTQVNRGVEASLVFSVGDNVVADHEVFSGAPHKGSWEGRLRHAAVDRQDAATRAAAETAERVRAAEEVAYQAKKRRLAELVEKPSVELSAAEYQEKMRLRREVLL